MWQQEIKKLLKFWIEKGNNNKTKKIFALEFVTFENKNYLYFKQQNNNNSNERSLILISLQFYCIGCDNRICIQKLLKFKVK